MKSYHFKYEKELEDNGFYTRDSFFEVSDIEIRLLCLSSLLITTQIPFKEFSHGIFKKYDKILNLCIEALNTEKDKQLTDKIYFKAYVFKEVIDCVVMKVCFRYIQSFTNNHRLKSKNNGSLTDKNGGTILDVFVAWQDLTGVWIPSTSIGHEFAFSFDVRINTFRPFMGWKISKRIKSKRIKSN